MPGVPETSLSALTGAELRDEDQANRGHLENHELCNPVSARDLEGRHGVRVYQYYRDLSPITRVDQAGSVEAAHTVAESKAAPREHQGCKTFWQLDGKTGRNEGTAAGWVKHEIDPRP